MSQSNLTHLDHQLNVLVKSSEDIISGVVDLNRSLFTDRPLTVLRTKHLVHLSPLTLYLFKVDVMSNRISLPYSKILRYVIYLLWIITLIQN